MDQVVDAKPIKDITYKVHNKTHKWDNSFNSSSSQSMKNNHSWTSSEINYDESMGSEKVLKSK